MTEQTQTPVKVDPAYVEIYRASVGHHHEEVMERLDFQMQLASGALKNLMLMNGGAVLALLTFAGNHGDVDVKALGVSFALFIAGLLLGLIAYLGGFLAQGQYMAVTVHQRSNAEFRMLGLEAPMDLDPPMRKGNLRLMIALASAVLSLGAFAGGAFQALYAIM